MISNTTPAGRGVVAVALTVVLVVSAIVAGTSLIAGGVGSAAPAGVGECTVATEVESSGSNGSERTSNGTCPSVPTNDSSASDAKLSAALRHEAAVGSEAARSMAAASVGDTAPLTVVVETDGAVDSVAATVRAAGGTVDLTHGDALQATLSRDALGTVAADPAVEFVRQPRRPESTVVSEGVSAINATALHDRGVTGENVTVAVVDVGGFNLSNPELDNVVAHRSFGASAIGNTTTGAHGTATAALVADTAPGADVVAVRVENYLQAQSAVAWLREDTDVDAVSMSLAWKDVGPLDGTAPLSREIDRSVEAGTPYFVAAGNAGGGNHWDGPWQDPDSDGWLNFDTDDELMTVGSTSYPSSLYFTLQWDDWPASDEDYDLYVYQYESDFDASDPDGGSPILVSDTTQSGSQDPLELFSRTAYGQLYVAVKSENATNSSYFTAFGGDQQVLTPSTTERSVTEPGVAASATTLGAVDYASGNVEPFSSRGPTLDGRRKPDLVAPDNVSTGTSATGFYGTSAAAPHAAGVAALMLGVEGDLSPAEVETAMRETATPVTGNEPNNRTGYGLVDAGAAVTWITAEEDAAADIEPIVGGRVSTDLDGDGVYEDVNGDGEFTYDDVVVFFEFLDGRAIQGSERAYDFDGNGGVTYNDVVVLFERASSPSSGGP